MMIKLPNMELEHYKPTSANYRVDFKDIISLLLESFFDKKHLTWFKDYSCSFFNESKQLTNYIHLPILRM